MDAIIFVHSLVTILMPFSVWISNRTSNKISVHIFQGIYLKKYTWFLNVWARIKYGFILRSYIHTWYMILTIRIILTSIGSMLRASIAVKIYGVLTLLTNWVHTKPSEVGRVDWWPFNFILSLNKSKAIFSSCILICKSSGTAARITIPG